MFKATVKKKRTEVSSSHVEGRKEKKGSPKKKETELPPQKTSGLFQLHSHYDPSGDQPNAIDVLSRNLNRGQEFQTLLGVTGSGKTFTMAHVIDRFQKPTLILAHNKTLAAQLYSEFKQLFPHNAVCYFVSYYDYYRPEAYIPSTDTYIDKDSQVNEEIDRMRHFATQSLLERRDVIVIASVSCIYGLGSPESYQKQQLRVLLNRPLNRDVAMAKLVEMQYERNDIDFSQGCFRVKGDILDIYPVHEEDQAIRISFFGDDVEEILVIDPLRGKVIGKRDAVTIYPASHYVAPLDVLKKAMEQIQGELEDRLRYFGERGRLLEAQRLLERTKYDLEAIKETGFCKGIENYTRHLTNQKEGYPPPCLLDYFPKKDWLLIVDESHVSIPQIKGMYGGDFSRKTTLVEHGFRLPSALDNRPLKLDEFLSKLNQVIFVSATPSDFEIEKSKGIIVEQVIRPTGLLDPILELRPALNQVDDFLVEVHKVIQKQQRVLITTLTKKMAEELTDHYQEMGIRVKYLHSEIDTIERTEILKGLRQGDFDVLVGINLLREGLDLPEVALVGIMDADKEGFLRNRSSLIQTIGRAARNLEGRVILYADKKTQSIMDAMDETQRRRELQAKFNEEHHIIPKAIQKNITDLVIDVDEFELIDDIADHKHLDMDDLQKQIDILRKEMHAFAKELRYEEATERREQVKELEKLLLKLK